MLAFTLLLIGAMDVAGLAQCAMCRQAVESSSDPEAVSRSLNLAILVLLIPPVAIFAGIFGVIYKNRNSQDER
jgi:hypothetical protein